MDFKLVMFKTNGQRKDFPVLNPVTVIGRGEDCDLRVPILNVSRHHSELHLSGDAVTVKDLGSSNGTYVNNQRINEARLNAGDRLTIGPIVFTVQVDGVPEEIRPVKTRGQQLAEAADTDLGEVVSFDEDVESSPPVSDAGQAQPGEQAKPTAPARSKPKPAPAAEIGEDDVIAALEALASEKDDQEDQD